MQMPDGRMAYTRDGSLELDAEGRLVTQDGFLVDPGVTIPAETKSVAISAAGLITGVQPGNPQPTQLGQIQLARFINKTGLESIGDNLYVETAARARPIDGNPGTEEFGSIQQGYLEEANVNAVVEITSLIQAQRAYEMNSRVVSAADQMLSSTRRCSGVIDAARNVSAHHHRFVSPALAERPSLRGDVLVHTDVVRLGDLVEGLVRRAMSRSSPRRRLVAAARSRRSASSRRRVI